MSQNEKPRCFGEQLTQCPKCRDYEACGIETARRTEKILPFTCPECGGHDLVHALYPQTRRDHYKGLNTETDTLEWSYVSTGSDVGDEDYWECMDCDYRLCEDDDTQFEISTDEEVIEWLKSHALPTASR
jgi:hypothetical protein